MNAPGTLALSADLPLVWESPELLRIGISHPVARLTGLSPAEQRFLSALVTGILPEHLGSTTRRCGLSPGRRDELLALVSTALGPPPSAPWARPTTQLRICVAAGGGWADAEWARVFAAALGATGAICSIALSANAVIDADVLVLPERYAAPQAQAAPWLSLGVPTLSLRLRDRAALLGPLLGVPGAPCLDCCNHAEAGRDPAWAAVTAQVSGKRPPSETASVALTLAAHGAALLRALADILKGNTATTSTGWEHAGYQIDVPVHHGLPRPGGSDRLVPRRVDCGCSLLAESERELVATENTIDFSQAGFGAPMPAAERKREGVRRARPPAADPESRSSSRARVSAT